MEEPKKNRILSYRCPECGAGVMSGIDPGVIKADMIKLKCDCGQSFMRVVYTDDGKARFEVPCLFCSETHRFTVKESILEKDDLFTLRCPYSMRDICFVGEINRVKAALAKSELDLLNELDEKGIEIGERDKDSNPVFDPTVYDRVIYVLKELEDGSLIHCRCGKGKAETRISVSGTDLLVECAKCGASRRIALDSSIATQAFLDCTGLYLE